MLKGLTTTLKSVAADMETEIVENRCCSLDDIFYPIQWLELYTLAPSWSIIWNCPHRFFAAHKVSCAQKSWLRLGAGVLAGSKSRRLWIIVSQRPRKLQKSKRYTYKCCVFI